MLDKSAIKELFQFNAIGAALGSMPAAVAASAIALPNDFAVTDLERYMPNRRRARGAMRTSIVTDFAAYAGMHKEPGAMCFVDQDKMTATAVLNLGQPAAPGHADSIAVYAPKKTAAYLALERMAAHGGGLPQKVVAEFLEDWPGEVQCFNETAELSPTKAISAVRNITIENLRKVGASEQQLSAERSTFESVKAENADTLPQFIYFTCMPYVGLQGRTFVLRLGILTEKVMLTLRIKNAELHAEQMAAEVSDLVRQAFNGSLPVAIGTYAATN